MIRIFLVDDHTVLRHGMRALLADRPGLAVVGEAGNGRDLFDQLPTTAADVVLLDVKMPSMGAAEITRQLREKYPATQVPEQPHAAERGGGWLRIWPHCVGTCPPSENRFCW